MNNIIGKRIFNIANNNSSPNLNDAGTRLIEEVTELALEMGATSGEIYDAVSDTLHKEANKHNTYPSILPYEYSTSGIKEELADSLINLLYCIHLCGIELPEIEKIAEEKTELLEKLEKQNKLVFTKGGKFYRVK